MSLLLLGLIGGCMGHSLFILNDEIHCTEGMSAYLPASYKMSEPFQMWPSFLWFKGEYNILYYSLLNGSIDGNGFPTWSSGECTIFPLYTGRVEFSEHNASLVLKDVQQNDSGSYTISFISAESTLSKTINLRVAGRNQSFNKYSHVEPLLVFVCVTVLLVASIIFLSTYRWRINAKNFTDAGKPKQKCVSEKTVHKVRETLAELSWHILLGKWFRLGNEAVVKMQNPINPMRPVACTRLTDEDAQ